MKRIPIIIFVIGLMFFSFGFGIVITYLDLFPIPQLRNAKLAYEALQEQEQTIPFDDYTFPTDATISGVAVHDADLAYSGVTFLTAFQGGRCTNVLIDMQGNIVHEWYIAYSDVWPKAPFLQHQATDDWTCWHGAHLFPNGDLILGFAGTGFPEGWGTVKLDKDSNVIWRMPRNTHHDIHVTEDGAVFVPAINYLTDETETPSVTLGPEFAATINWDPPLELDIVLELSPDGTLLSEFSILDAIHKSDYKGLLSITAQKKIAFNNTQDPTHLNNIEIVTAEWALHHSFVNAGDILVSLRNLSTIAAIDKDSKIVKWAMTGPFIRQHDPDLLPNGNILLYDNWGGNPEAGRSRILEIDPESHEIVWQYAGTTDKPFYSEIRGVQQKLPNANVLITEPQGGRIMEVTSGSEPVIVWEYLNEVTETDEGDHRIGTIIQAQRFAPQELTFLQTRSTGGAQ